MPDQLMFPFACDETKLRKFLTQWCAIEDEHERLREESRLLKEQYQDAFPMRATLTAIKVTRVRRKLADHPIEPMSYPHQELLETFVERHLALLDREPEGTDLVGARH